MTFVPLSFSSWAFDYIKAAKGDTTMQQLFIWPKKWKANGATSNIKLFPLPVCEQNRLSLPFKTCFKISSWFGQRPITLLDSSKSINIKSISTAATVMSTALQNCKINCLYSVLPGKLEVIILIALLNWYKIISHCHKIDHSNNNNR